MKSYFNEMLNSTMELLSIDSVQSEPHALSPFGEGVGLCINKTMEIASKLGFTTHNEEGYYCTATIGSGEEFGILGHLDVVPYAKEEWSHSPLGEISNDVIFGRGILDDKGPMMECLYAVYELIQNGYTPKKTIKFIFGGNEESGWRCIDRYNELEKMPESGFSPDADFPVIHCEKGICSINVEIPMPKGLIMVNGGDRANIVMNKIEAIYNGILNQPKDKNVSIKIKDGKTYILATGTAAHGSTPEKGDNAFWHLINYLADNDNKAYSELKQLTCHNDGKGINLCIKDVSGPLTFNVGVAKNIKSENNEDLLKLSFDIRFPITYTKEFIAESISKAFNTYATIEHFHNPLFVKEDDELVVKLLNAYRNVTSDNETKPIKIGGGTYARALKHGVAFGPIFPHQESTIHQTDERVTIDDFKKAYEIYVEGIKNTCF